MRHLTKSSLGNLDMFSCVLQLEPQPQHTSPPHNVNLQSKLATQGRLRGLPDSIPTSVAKATVLQVRQERARTNTGLARFIRSLLSS